MRVIAAQLHGGQRSALSAFTSTRAVTEPLHAELDAWRTDSETGVEVEPWLDALDEYLDSRDHPDPIESWVAALADRPRTG